MCKTNLYVICRNSIEALEAWDANDIEPEVVFGPASIALCWYMVSHGYSRPNYYIATHKGD